MESNEDEVKALSLIAIILFGIEIVPILHSKKANGPISETW